MAFFRMRRSSLLKCRSNRGTDGRVAGLAAARSFNVDAAFLPYGCLTSFTDYRHLTFDTGTIRKQCNQMELAGALR